VAIADWKLLEDGVPVCQAGDGGNALQQWFVEYLGDGYFHIRNNHTGKYMEAKGSNDVIQGDGTSKEAAQWRFFPADHAVEYVAPAAPAALTVKAAEVAVRLEWQKSADQDAANYTIYRSNRSGGPYDAIAVTAGTRYIDATANRNAPYYYVVKTTDHALNHSEMSKEATATPSGGAALVAHLAFEDDLRDASQNGSDGTLHGSPEFGPGKLGKAIVLDGREDYLALPAEIVNYKTLTVAVWVYWNGGSDWQRIFDFGNDTNHYMFLTPKNGEGAMRFGIKNGGQEQQLNSPPLPEKQWVHVAVVLEAGRGKLYVNGIQRDSRAMPISPAVFNPVTIWIGKSNFPDPLFDGMVDDFRIYNYPLPPEQVMGLSKALTP
jgi:Concanavalin A-like lectin/glucanases superfamily/Ricin-type beta-trefoil lectin domain-like